MSEPFVITRLCRDCVDGACVDVCPVDCIYEVKEQHDPFPNQLFINPEECIYCSACEPACPWEAIYDSGSVPLAFEADIALNAITDTEPERFDVAVSRLTARPHQQDVADNKRKWGLVDPALSA